MFKEILKVMSEYRCWADKLAGFRFNKHFHLGLGDIRLACGDVDDLIVDLMDAHEMEVENARLREEIDAARKVCEVYFEIAADAIGEDAVRTKRDAMITKRIARAALESKNEE